MARERISALKRLARSENSAQEAKRARTSMRLRRQRMAEQRVHDGASGEHHLNERDVTDERADTATHEERGDDSTDATIVVDSVPTISCGVTNSIKAACNERLCASVKELVCCVCDRWTAAQKHSL
jgi:hypothetical protein